MSINGFTQTPKTSLDSVPVQALLPIDKILPPNIMEEIFSYETRSEKATSSCVSKSWNEITTSSSILRKRWLFQGNQQDCTGPVVVSEAESIRARLSSQSPDGIKFTTSRMDYIIEGGTCSAMSLEFLDDYFKARKKISAQSHFQSETLLFELSKLGKKFSTSSQEFRNRQAAFNKIAIKGGDKIKESNINSWTPFYSKRKVEALANYHSLAINHCSDVIDIERDSLIKVSSVLSELPEGAFLLRALKPDRSEKWEEFGHSMVYIKDKDFTLFYDPNFGLKNITKSKHSKAVFEGLQLYFGLGISTARLYRLEPK